jgi:ADP-ribose pyrophosphatase
VSREPAPGRRRLVHQGSALSFWLEEIELPNGSSLELEVVRHPGASTVVPFLDPDHILLLWQYRHAAGGYIWEVPAGKLEPGEAPEACARRELEEETGYRAGRLEETGVVLTTPGFSDERIHLFCAWDLTPGQTAHESSEVIEVHEVPFAEALAMVDRGEIVDGKTLAALFHAARRRSAGGAPMF